MANYLMAACRPNVCHICLQTCSPNLKHANTSTEEQVVYKTLFSFVFSFIAEMKVRQNPGYVPSQHRTIGLDQLYRNTIISPGLDASPRPRLGHLWPRSRLGPESLGLASNTLTNASVSGLNASVSASISAWKASCTSLVVGTNVVNFK